MRRSAIHRKPSKRSIWFNGRPINVDAVAADLRVNRSYLYKVLTCKCQPSLDRAKLICDYLDMSLDEFWAELSRKRKALALNLQAELAIAE